MEKEVCVKRRPTSGTYFCLLYCIWVLFTPSTMASSQLLGPKCLLMFGRLCGDLGSVRCAMFSLLQSWESNAELCPELQPQPCIFTFYFETGSH